MGPPETTRATVLVVDDEEDVTDLYARFLTNQYEVLRAYSGRGALETLSTVDGGVDVVLLDRQMPGLGGDETLDRLREAGYDCRVAMVTAIDPDFDVLEMPFDDYVEKPVTRAELLDVVERLLQRAAYGETVRQYYALVSTAATLADAKSKSELAGNDQYRALLTRIESLADSTPSPLPGPTDDREWAALLDDVLDDG